MSKFKVGDKVTVVRDFRNVKKISFPSQNYVGRSFIIATINNVALLPKGQPGAYIEDCELTYILNSPLYKALS